MVFGDILVDDKPKTFEQFITLGRDAILMNMPYNRPINTKWRTNNLKEEEEMLYHLLKKRGKLVS